MGQILASLNLRGGTTDSIVPEINFDIESKVWLVNVAKLYIESDMLTRC